MKRLYIAITLLLAASSICAFQISTIRDTTDKFCGILDDIAMICASGNKPLADKLAKDMLIKWDTESQELDKFVYHDYVDNITIALSEIPLYIKIGSNEETKSYINGIKIQLASLSESELPYIHNII